MTYYGFFKKLSDLNMPDCLEIDIYSKYFAKLYDRLTRNIMYDLELYTQQVKEVSGPVLELGCGSGRVLLRLAAQGCDITGIDNSEDMLEVLSEKLNMQDKEVAGRVKYFNMDINRLSIDRKFSLIIMPGATFSSIKFEVDMETMLQSIYEHLDTGGRFIFDYNFFLEGKIEDSKEDGLKAFTWEEPGGTKDFYLIGAKQEAKFSRVVVNYYAETIKDHNTSRYLGCLIKRMISTDELLNLILEKTKFKIIHTRIFEGNRTDASKFIILEK